MDYRFDVDPHLPALPMAFDLDAVSRLFEERWPVHGGLARAHVPVNARRLLDTKYQPSKRCVTSYELLVEHPANIFRTTIGAVEVTPTGIAHRLFVDDPELPGLRTATDPVAMAERFATLLERMGCAAAVESCQVIPIRYKPESRCVVRYDLRTSTGRQILYGKLIAQNGEGLTATINELYRVSQDMPGMPRIARPLAYWPEIQMLVQPAIRGDELNIRAFDNAESYTKRVQWMHEAGASLAALHASAAIDGLLRTLADDLSELEQYRAPVMIVSRTLGTRYEEALTAIASMARGRVEPAPVKSHGAFRTDQLLVENDRLTVIDLDSFCWANPARDIGNFLAYLDWKAIRKPQHAAFIERAKCTFIEGYVEVRPVLDPFWLALYQAISLLKIAGRRFRSLTFAEMPLVPHLLDLTFETLTGAAD